MQPDQDPSQRGLPEQHIEPVCALGLVREAPAPCRLAQGLCTESTYSLRGWPSGRIWLWDTGP